MTTRLRRKLLMTMLAVGSIGLLVLGKRHSAEFQRTASYLPDSVFDVLYHERKPSRWDDGSQALIKKPKFHLLIPTHINQSDHLCETLLSAAILNYPPPTLIQYENEEEAVPNFNAFLLGKETRDSDLVLVVSQHTWFQLPAKVLINRFFHGQRDSNAKLLETYGFKPGNITAETSRTPQYTQRVILAATKECSNDGSDPACRSIPQSPLPHDIYGQETDNTPGGTRNRPKFLGSGMLMGRTSDLRPLFKHASKLLESGDLEQSHSQYLFSKIFGEQEHQRSAFHQASLTKSGRWKQWVDSTLSQTTMDTSRPNMTVVPGRNYEFGIGLDYTSSIFQVMDKSMADIQWVKFNHPSIIASPSRSFADSFKNPIHLPLDLKSNITAPPFSQNRIYPVNPRIPFSTLDNIPRNNITWSDIELATNIIVPGSSVPASLSYEGNEPYMRNQWGNMWFQKHSRALLRQYIRSAEGPIAAEAAAQGGDRWWDLRGGKGGIWTGRGEWLEWNEVCENADVFRDGKGVFGREDEEKS